MIAGAQLRTAVRSKPARRMMLVVFYDFKITNTVGRKSSDRSARAIDRDAGRIAEPGVENHIDLIMAGRRPGRYHEEVVEPHGFGRILGRADDGFVSCQYVACSSNAPVNRYRVRSRVLRRAHTVAFNDVIVRGRSVDLPKFVV